jgi:hypothetical protein
MYWMLILGLGYALGAFMAAGWRPYAAALPVAASVAFLTHFMFVSGVAFGAPLLWNFLTGFLMYTPVIMLGVFVAQRKAKADAY